MMMMMMMMNNDVADISVTRQAVMGKITCKVILNQNQNHLYVSDFKSKSPNN